MTNKTDEFQLIYIFLFWSLVYSLWPYSATFYLEGWKYLIDRHWEIHNYDNLQIIQCAVTLFCQLLGHRQISNLHNYIKSKPYSGIESPVLQFIFAK